MILVDNSLRLPAVARATLAAALIFTAMAPANAEEFLLASGGSVSGTWLNPDENPRQAYQIKTAIGVMQLEPEQVKQVVRLTPRRQQYAELLTRMPPTAEGNWKMAQWCQQNYLEDLRRQHLEACLVLEPNHEGARRAMGFTRHDGKWELVEVLNRKMGMIRHGNRWHLPAEIVLKKSADEREVKQKRLAGQLKLWRTWFVKGKKRGESQQQLMALRDPLAVPGLSKMLTDEEEESIEWQRLVIRSLRNIGDESGSLALIDISLQTNNATVRSDALDTLKELGRLRAIAAFTAKLKDKSPKTINAAAIGLSAMQAHESIPELIDALVTDHKIRISNGGGAINPTFSNNGGGGLSMGGGPKEVKTQSKNDKVRTTLVALTKVDYGFNETAWKNWFVLAQKPITAQLRRDH